MKTLKACSQHYIRCIKPNDKKSAGIFQDDLVLSQVRYLGLSENVKVKRAGFAFRLDYGRFLAKFKAVSKSFEWQPESKKASETIVKSAGVKDYQMGKSKIFIKSPKSIFLIEDKRQAFLEQAASYLPEGDGVIYADKVMAFNEELQRSPMFFIVGGEGFYFFSLR